jgi:hypothetical protein
LPRSIESSQHNSNNKIKSNQSRTHSTSDKIDSKHSALKRILKTTLDDLDNSTGSSNLELEVRFGTKGIKKITKIDQDNVAKKLLSLGFTISSEEYILRCFNEFIDPKSGIQKISSIRTEITGLNNIQNFCRHNSIEKIIETNEYSVEFTQKMPAFDANKRPIPTADFNDFNFRVALNKENKLQNNSNIVKNIISSWNDTKKTYRFMNRTTFMPPDYLNPIKIDLSVVKESHYKGRFMVPEYTISEAEVFQSLPKYEIEIEMQNHLLTRYKDIEKLETLIKHSSKTILSGLQKTNFPTSYIEQKSVIDDYLKLVKKNQYREDAWAKPRDFIGPSSMSLSMSNIAPLSNEINIPNIRKKYTVTDKADGDRKMLFINASGKIYLIDTNMSVQFTGAIVTSNEFHNTLLDGEHVLHDKTGKFINLYAAFDAYFIGGDDKRSLAFDINSNEDVKSNFRLHLLTDVIKSLNPKSIVNQKDVSPIKIKTKTFYNTNDNKTIFDGCASILQKEKDGLFEYNTDGLIFTPMDKGVGSSTVGEEPSSTKKTWEYSLKWKPPEFNTIDFLITTKKSSNGEEAISNMFDTGTNVYSTDQVIQYKTLILRVGFNERDHGYINPCNDIYDDKMPSIESKENEDQYKPVKFFPTNPSDPEAHLCNVLLSNDANGDKVMMTKEGEAIEDEMIVEFYYDTNEKKEWRWKPLRVRYDKTTEYRAGLKNYGNAYSVANSNWQSIHNPITIDMISTGQNIPQELGDDDVYYNKLIGVSKTRGLRDFHNLFVKKALIMGVSKRGNTLIDYAVGKAGDLPKWIASNLSFVFGIDIARDNIENNVDGACARYLNYKKKHSVMPSALFLNGNSSVNIKNTDALYTDRAKQITRAVFGSGPKDEKILGKGVIKQYGKGSEGFNVSSIQFAIHYMFETNNTLQNFIRNVAECTKLDGYFITTSYDGETIFNMLRDKQVGESMSIYEDETKIWEVKKMYDNDAFEDNVSSLGYAIDVFQESINKSFREYLVNYKYFNRLMENYGFILITKEEATSLGLPAPSGMFNELYTVLENEVKRNPSKINDYGTSLNMSSGEKNISFLNRFCVYKKVRNVNAEELSMALLSTTRIIENEDEKETRNASIAANKISNEKVKVKKLKRKIRLIME